MSIIHTEKQLRIIQSEMDSDYAKFKESLLSKQIQLDQIKKEITAREKKLSNTANLVKTNLDSNIDKERFIAFLKKPYTTKPLGKNKILVFVPKWVPNFEVGWLHEEKDEYYIYELNQYSAWLGDVPDELLSQINFEEGIKATVEGNRVFFDEEQKSKAYGMFKGHVTKWESDQAYIKQGHEFDIISQIIKSGYIPYQQKPVSKSDLRESESIKLRDYQKLSYDTFLQTGAIGLFYPTGAGKSFVSMKGIDSLKGNKLVIVPGITIAEQWQWYIDEYIPHCKDEVTISTYQGFKNFDSEFMLTIYDECHRLPANTFSKLSTIKTKYRIGLSASPHREDGRESLIFALTGQPVGINWQKYMSTVGRSYHPIHLYTVLNMQQKLAKLRELFNPEKKTFVFCDSIDLGKKVSQRLGIPFINGETSNRLDEIENNKAVVISRVGDMGVSVDDLERIIEIDFLFGSRQQELQRTGRLMHSQAKSTRHDIIMTDSEFSQYGKRIWALREKGFEIKIHSNGIRHT